MENKLNDLKPLFSHILEELCVSKEVNENALALECKLFRGISLLRNKTETLATQALKVNVTPLTSHNPSLTYRVVHHQL